jgi:NAD-dependent SIR2 family protein deacetylase
MLILNDFYCPKCDHQVNDILHDPAKPEDAPTCEKCETKLTKKFTAPRAMFSKTWHTGMGVVHRREMKVTYDDGHTEFHNLRDRVKDFG